MISIVLTTYNGEKYLKEQLDSILCQTLKPDEIIVIDDCSTDLSVKVAREALAGSGIAHYIEKNDKNMGHMRTFEKGMGIAQGDYIAFSDQDDIWHPNKLQWIMDSILKEKMADDIPLLAFSDCDIIDQTGVKINESFCRYQKLQPNKMIKNIYALCVQNVVTGMCAVINRSLKELCRTFPPDTMFHDWWLGLVACGLGKLIYIDKPLVHYRLHSENVIGPSRYHDIIWAESILKNLFRPAKLIAYLHSFHYEVFTNYRNHCYMRGIQAEKLYCVAGRQDFRLQKLAFHLKYGGLRADFYFIKYRALPPTLRRKLFFLLSMLKKRAS